MSNKIKEKYKTIYIVDSDSLWEDQKEKYEINNDLILTYDYGMKKKIKFLKGDVYYIDHLCKSDVLTKNNHIIYNFLSKWYYREDGEDIFKYNNIPFGFSFKLDFLNDYISYCRLSLSLSVLKSIQYSKIVVISETGLISEVLNDLSINHIIIDSKRINTSFYYFPISQWLEEKIRPKGIRKFLYQVRDLLSLFHANLMIFIDKFRFRSYKTVFIQAYHPTFPIIKNLNQKKIKILLSSIVGSLDMRTNLSLRFLPIPLRTKKYEMYASDLIQEFKDKQCQKLILSNGIDISNKIYLLIESKIKTEIVRKLNIIDASIQYIDNHGVNLNVLIANIGEVVTVFDCVSRYKNIPSYLIINGLIPVKYGDESKYATIINSYSQSMKANYFEGMDNIVTLGDPRMDWYYKFKNSKLINRVVPTISIGASGFTSNSLHGFVAMEFEFLYEVLFTFQNLLKKNKFNINIKVRPNGYINQYEKFIETFFPEMEINIEDTKEIQKIFLETDLYISIHSQTLFEASCMGIPVIYYKNGTEIFTEPFDNNSELVTVLNPDELNQAFYDFKNGNERFNSFLDRKVMEKYIGPLDGKNLERNLDFINKLLSENTND